MKFNYKIQMNKYISLLLILFSLTAFTQNKGKALLNEVSQKVKSYENISIDFKYTLENLSENLKQETRGDVVMKGNQYRLNLLGITQLYDGKKLYSIDSGDEEVTISSKKDADGDAFSPSKMLSFYEGGYTYALDIEQNINGRKVQYVKLTPIDSNDETKYILVGVDSQTKHIYNLIQVGKNGTKTILTVNSFKTNTLLPKTIFTFDKSKYGDYYINNLD